MHYIKYTPCFLPRLPYTVLWLSVGHPVSFVTGAEFLGTQGPTGEVAYGWQECRLMGDVLVLHDLVDDDSDSV